MVVLLREMFLLYSKLGREMTSKPIRPHYSKYSYHSDG